jgi:hypothetical protein
MSNVTIYQFEVYHLPSDGMIKFLRASLFPRIVRLLDVVLIAAPMAYTLPTVLQLAQIRLQARTISIITSSVDGGFPK